MIDEFSHSEQIMKGTFLEVADRRVFIDAAESLYTVAVDNKGVIQKISNMISKTNEIREVIVATAESFANLAGASQVLELVKGMNNGIIQTFFASNDYINRYLQCRDSHSRGQCTVAASSYLVAKIGTNILGGSIIASSIPAAAGTPATSVAVATSGIFVISQAENVGNFAYNAAIKMYDLFSGISIIPQASAARVSASDSITTTKNNSSSNASSNIANTIEEVSINETIAENETATEEWVAACNNYSESMEKLREELRSRRENENICADVLSSVDGATSCIVGAARLLGRPKVAAQAAAIGGGIVSAANIASSIAMGAINPLAAIGGVLNIVGNISDAFGKDVDTNAAVMEGLAAISQQIADLHEQMMERFDNIDEHLKLQDKLAIRQFCALSRNMDSISDKIAQLSEDMARGFVGTRLLLGDISQAIEGLRQQITCREILSTNESIECIVYDTIRYSAEDPAGYVERMRKLETLILYQLSHPKYTEMMPGTGTISAQEANYMVNLLSPEGERIVNPQLFYAAALSLIHATLTQYPDNETTAEKTISIYDIERLTQVRDIGYRLKNWFEEMKDLRVLNSFIENYETISRELIGRATEEHLRILTDVTKERMRKRKRRYEELYYRPRDIEKFRASKIKFRPIYGSWMTGHTEECDNGHWFPHHYISSGPYNHILSLYTSFISAQIDKQINDYIEQMDAYYGKNRVAGEPREHLPWFIFPAEGFEGYPILPATRYCLNGNFIQDKYLRRDLPMRFEYTLTPLEEEGYNHKINVRVIFILDDDSEVHAYTISAKINTKFYDLPEGLWWSWMGGRYPLSIEPKTVINGYTGNYHNQLRSHVNIADIPEVKNYDKYTHAIYCEEGEQVIKKAITDKNREREIKTCNILAETGIFQSEEIEKCLSLAAAYLHIISPCGASLSHKIQIPRNKKFNKIRKYFSRELPAALYTAREQWDSLIKTGGTLDTILVLYDNVLNYYGGRYVKYNYWYIDESEKISIMSNSVRAVVSAISYIDPANVDEYINRHVRPLMLEIPAEIVRDAIDELTISDVLRHAIMPSNN